MKSLLILYSYHHHNTEKIAKEMASVLHAQIQKPKQVIVDHLDSYDLIGFGSGIYSSKHHQSLLQLADTLPSIKEGKAFLFSTCGTPAFALERGKVDEYLKKINLPLKEKLESKGFIILDEFVCPGWNTNSFLKLFGGINKGRPNKQDLTKAQQFAESLLHKLE